MSAGSPISWDGLRSLHKLRRRRADWGAECGRGQRGRAAHSGGLSAYLSALRCVSSRDGITHPGTARALNLGPAALVRTSVIQHGGSWL